MLHSRKIALNRGYIQFERFTPPPDESIGTLSASIAVTHPTLSQQKTPIVMTVLSRVYTSSGADYFTYLEAVYVPDESAPLTICVDDSFLGENEWDRQYFRHYPHLVLESSLNTAQQCNISCGGILHFRSTKLNALDSVEWGIQAAASGITLLVLADYEILDELNIQMMFGRL